MFATLLGALPRPDDETNDLDRVVEIGVRAQEDAGFEPITDGRLRGVPFGELPAARDLVAAWRATQGLTDRAVKQALPGPFSFGAPVEQLVETVAALAEAGCPLIEIEETAVERLSDPHERDSFRAAHERLLDRADGVHMSLSITGGAPPEDARPTVLELPYQSLAVDLIGGPDSWNLVTRLAGDRGVIAGVESAAETDEPTEVLLWAAHYAASTKGRGPHRVGLGSAGSWANLTWEAAVRKMRLLGDAARLATLPPGSELAHAVDPKSISARRAALGHDA